MEKDVKYWSQLSLNPIDKIYNDVEYELLLLIADIIKKSKSNFSLIYNIEKLNDIGRLNSETVKIIDNLLSKDDIINYYQNFEKKEIEKIEVILKRSRNKKKVKSADYIKEINNSFIKDAVDDFNFVNTTMLKKTQEIYIEIINKTSLKLLAGISTPEIALSQTIKEFTENGIPIIRDKKNRKWNLEGYVSMVNRTTSSNIINTINDNRALDFGVSLINISSHGGARPLCFPYQGLVYSLDGSSGTTKNLSGDKINYYPLSSTSYGQPAGIFGINCRHVRTPFIPNISFLEDNEFSKNENDNIYELTQKQRKMEREIRKLRRVNIVISKSGLDNKKQKMILKNKLKEIKSFTENNNLTRVMMNEKIFN